MEHIQSHTQEDPREALARKKRLEALKQRMPQTEKTPDDKAQDLREEIASIEMRIAAREKRLEDIAAGTDMEIMNAQKDYQRLVGGAKDAAQREDYMAMWRQGLESIAQRVREEIDALKGKAEALREERSKLLGG